MIARLWAALLARLLPLPARGLTPDDPIVAWDLFLRTPLRTPLRDLLPRSVAVDRVQEWPDLAREEPKWEEGPLWGIGRL